MSLKKKKKFLRKIQTLKVIPLLFLALLFLSPFFLDNKESQIKTEIVLFCLDSDADGYDNCSLSTTGDDGKESDCNDNNAQINPGKTEVCGNGIDDNCVNGVDEGCGSGAITGKAYYVSSTQGNDANPGTFDKPWKTMEKVNSFSFQTGDDVYFKCGDTFTPTAHLNVDWEGTAANPAVIGAYYLSGGQPVAGVSGARPIISGSDWTVPNSWFFGTSKTRTWKGMIHIASKDWITVKDLVIYRSGDEGIWIAGNIKDGPPTNSSHFVIENVKIFEACGNALGVANNPENYGIIRGVEMERAQYGWKYAIEDEGENFDIWGASLTVSGCANANMVIEDCYVHHGWGEGILVYRHGDSSMGAGYVTIRNNVIFNNRRVDIYLDGVVNCEVYGNLCLGGSSSAVGNTWTSKYSDGRNWNANGIWLNAEVYPYATGLTISNNKIYNNIIAGHFTGLSFDSEIYGNIENIEISNNTVIGNYNNLSLSTSGKISGCTTKNVNIRNNIFYSPSDTISQNVKNDWSWADSKINLSNNAWTGSLPANIGNPSTDVVINNNFAKATGWQELSDVIDASKAKLLAGSSAINAGVKIDAVRDDFFKAVRALSYDIGAHEYGGTSTTPPPATTADSTAPLVNTFSAVKYSSTQAKINWNVSDAGGSHLDRIEVWRTLDSSNLPNTQLWKELFNKEQILYPSDINSHQGEVIDGVFDPSLAYWYKIKVFDQSQNQVESSSQKILFSSNTTLRADFDSDNDVDIFDFNILIQNFSATSSCQNPADADGDCNVGIFDYNILLGEFGSGT